MAKKKLNKQERVETLFTNMANISKSGKEKGQKVEPVRTKGDKVCGSFRKIPQV